MKSEYVDKIPTLALLMLGGLSEEDLLSYPEVTREDLSEARKLLARRGWTVGKCEDCGKISWTHNRVWESETTINNGRICGDCENSLRRKSALVE